MIHHDYENSAYWGSPNSLRQKQIITVIVDIRNPVRVLNELINNHIYEGEHCGGLKSEVVRYICESLLIYVRENKSLLDSSNENISKAMYCLLDYQLPMVLASEIFHKTETSVIESLMNVVPDIDDERKYRILDHKIVDNDALRLTLEVIDD